MARKRTSQYGPIYRGREGQWSWVLHRATGVGIILFLFSHVVDTAVVGWGPEAYEKVLSVYHNPFVLVLELALVGMVIYHAFNGIRIMVIDFWPKAAQYHVPIFYVTMGLFVLVMVPVTWIIGRSVLRAIGWL